MRRPGPPGQPLALLDVLCCGLGAAVMLLMLVRQAPASAQMAAQVEQAQAALLQAQDELAEWRRLLAAADAQTAQATQALQAARGGRSAAESALQRRTRSAQAAAQSAQADKALLHELLASEEAETRTEMPPPPKQLTGLRMLPDRTLVLLDRSASMLHRNIVDIVRLRASPAAAQLSAHKWRTARDAAQWALARIPQGGRRRLLMFANAVIGVDAPMPAAGVVSWERQGAPEQDAADLRRQLDAAAPEGATNLKAALQAATRLSPAPRQVLIITDGLPTLPGATPLRSLRGCPRVNRPNAPIVSGDCRMSVFLNAVRVAERQLAGTRFDVILLPIEGDAHATQGYWILAALSGGRLLSPAFGWPTS